MIKNIINLLSYSSKYQRCEMGPMGLPSWGQQGFIPFWKLYGEIKLIACSISTTLPHSCIMVPFHFQGQQLYHSDLYFCHHISFSNCPRTLPLFHLQGHSGFHWAHFDNPEQSSHLKDLNLITSSKSLCPCRVNVFIGSRD